MSENQQQEAVHKSPIQVGAAWKKTSTKNDQAYLSVAAVGGRELDQYELILRHKETQTELDLFNPKACSVVVVSNTFKREDVEADAKKPDFIIKAFLKE